MRPAIRRSLDILLMCFALMQAPFVSGQQLTPADSEYYLYQPFWAAAEHDRQPLNHLGMRVSAHADGFLVTAALDGYPAQAAGILRGDVINTSNGEAFHPVYSLNDQSRSPASFTANPTPVSIGFTRGTQQMTAEATPVFESLYDSLRSASLNSIQQFPSGNKIVGYVRFWSVSRNSNDLIALHRLISELSHCDGIIIDLRDAYGFLDSAQLQLIYRGTANLFTVRGSATDQLQHEGYPLAPLANYRQPIALLINEQTEAGAELLAYQLDKLSRVVTIGQGTAGKIGQYQQQGQGESGSETAESLRYQPALETILDGQQFEGNGHQPERPVPYPYTQPGRVDPQFQTAMEVLMGII